MPLRPGKSYSRFNVGTYMKTLKQKRESLAATNKSIQDKNKLLKTAKQKLKRVDLKVCINKQLPLLGTTNCKDLLKCFSAEFYNMLTVMHCKYCKLNTIWHHSVLSKTVSLQNSLFKNNKKLCSIRCRANQSRFCGTMFEVE